jgi:hypothetical protein
VILGAPKIGGPKAYALRRHYPRAQTTQLFKLTEPKYSKYEYDDSTEEGKEDDIFDSFVGDLQGEDGEDGLGSNGEIFRAAQEEEYKAAHESGVETILKSNNII